MDTLYKILDVLLETLGPSAVKEHVEKQSQETPTTAPEQKKIIIKKVKKSSKMDTDMEEITTGLEGLTIQKAAAPPKSKESRRCDARICGEKLLIEGTTSPNGGPYAVYKHAQCEEKASHSITDEDDGKLYLCKMCMKRYTSRQEFPVIWHGFFDVDDPPETSHFINSKWHKAKLATVQ
jgi:hypothetical protein